MSARVRRTVREGRRYMELTAEAKARAKAERDEELVRVGARVRELRRERGFTQKDLSEAAGLHRVNLNKLENGRADLGISRVRALADALGVHPGELFE